MCVWNFTDLSLVQLAATLVVKLLWFKSQSGKREMPFKNDWENLSCRLFAKKWQFWKEGNLLKRCEWNIKEDVCNLSTNMPVWGDLQSLLCSKNFVIWNNMDAFEPKWNFSIMSLSSTSTTNYSTTWTFFDDVILNVN